MCKNVRLTLANEDNAGRIGGFSQNPVPALKTPICPSEDKVGEKVTQI